MTTETGDPVAELRARLISGQARIAEEGVPLIVLIAGSESLRADAFWALSSWLDPRPVEAHAFEHSDIERGRRPEFTLWFNAVPRRGEIGLFYTGWYGIVVRDYLEHRIDRNELASRVEQLEDFENMLRRDGYRIVKLWLTLSEKEHNERLRQLSKEKASRWKITRTDEIISKHYKRWARLSELADRTRDRDNGWQVIQIADDEERHMAVVRAVADAMEVPTSPPRVSRYLEPADVPHHLGSVDLSHRVGKKEYRKELARLSAEIATLFEEANTRQQGVVLAFEGWDAAGKGGTIKRVLAAGDPRDIRAIRVAAPTPEELSRHYLWRFTREIPERGEVAVFDRTWYGRVLVERVEEFTTSDRWTEAYEEIVQFESELSRSGYLVLKFWLHISEEEQLRRFQERETIEYKLYKITDEDWRNREKRGAYEAAVNEMIERTHHEHGPWHVISAENKRAARLDVMRSIATRLRIALQNGA